MCSQAEVIRFAGVDGIAQLLGQPAGEIRAANCAGQLVSVRPGREVQQVAGAVRAGRHADIAGVDALGLARALVIGEEEDFVAPDRPPEGASVLVLEKRTARGRKVVAGIEIGVAQKLEGAAVKRIAAGLGDHADLAAAEFPVFGVKVAGDDAELGDRVEVGHDGRARVHVFFRIGAVHAEGVGKSPAGHSPRWLPGFSVPDGSRIVAPTSCTVVEQIEVAGATPGCSDSRSVKLRPFSGTAVICRPPIT